MKNYSSLDYDVVMKVRKNRIKVWLTIDGKIYKGRATCHKDDIFDIDTGYEIAIERAVKKYEDERYNEIQKVIAEPEIIQDGIILCVSSRFINYKPGAIYQVQDKHIIDECGYRKRLVDCNFEYKIVHVHKSN